MTGAFQSTQPEWAATKDKIKNGEAEKISIHAARVGCDGNAESGIGTDDNFNPRSPSGLRQEVYRRASEYIIISIHAARVGCDNGHGHIYGKLSANFNPRSPSGLRRVAGKEIYGLLNISIHAARVGCDSWAYPPGSRYTNFNPRSPSGLRPPLRKLW